MKSLSTHFPLAVVLLLAQGGCQDDFDTGIPVATVAGSTEAVTFRGGQDWPQWRGLGRDGVSLEERLVRSWPPGGPTEIWRRAIGTGYSGIVVSNHHLYTLDQNGDESLLALSAVNGQELWHLSLGSGFSSDQGDGPRGTPAADQELVFAVSGRGILVAADRSSGRQVWKHDLPREFDSTSPTWGFSTSPLVKGELVLVEPGGQGGGSLAAFRKNDGTLVWSSHGDPVGYSSPLGVEFQGQPQILFFTGRNLLSVTLEQGKVLWQVPWTTSYDVNASTPIWIPPNRVFISSGYGVGGAVFPGRSGRTGRCAIISAPVCISTGSCMDSKCHAQVHRRRGRIHEMAGERSGPWFSDFRRRDVDRPGGKGTACSPGREKRRSPAGLEEPGDAQSFQHQCVSQRVPVWIRQCHAQVHRRRGRIHEMAGERSGPWFSDFRRRDVDRPGGKGTACSCRGHARGLQRARTCPGAQRQVLDVAHACPQKALPEKSGRNRVPGFAEVIPDTKGVLPKRDRRVGGASGPRLPGDVQERVGGAPGRLPGASGHLNGRCPGAPPTLSSWSSSSVAAPRRLPLLEFHESGIWIGIWNPGSDNPMRIVLASASPRRRALGTAWNTGKSLRRETFRYGRVRGGSRNAGTDDRADRAAEGDGCSRARQVCNAGDRGGYGSRPWKPDSRKAFQL